MIELDTDSVLTARHLLLLDWFCTVQDASATIEYVGSRVELTSANIPIVQNFPYNNFASEL